MEGEVFDRESREKADKRLKRVTEWKHPLFVAIPNFS
jgi:hypothetical protein